ncbi:SIR2 family protein [Marivita sp.]|uniref:SIR2 family protein n=1 Tax=Marivita sp. TaxID=2003365 RepID=UPI003A836021
MWQILVPKGRELVVRFEEIDEAEKRRLCDFMLAQRVYLFVGSGVSLDSIGPDGEMFSAGKLREELVALNSLPSNATLQKAYSALSDEQVEKHITHHYTCTENGPTITRLANQPWRRVYSLNVDNCFESAFGSVIEANEFSPTSIETLNFDDSFVELLADKRASIIHLHGWVEQTQSGYVFSQNEYAKAMTRPNSWMLTLSQLIRTETFIVAGTSFDEIDVEYYLEQRSQKTVRGDVPPSVLIEPYPNKLTEMLCENHQFCLFEGTVLDFFSRLEAIDDRLRMPWRNNESDGLSGLDLPESERLRFSSNFHRPPDDPQKIPNPGRFLLGAELDWSMLAANSDIAREAFSDVRRDVVTAADSPQFKLILLVDEPGSGKTAFLKRLAFDLSRGSDEVFW